MKNVEKYSIFIFLLIVIWNILFPGYLLTLDMVFVPHMPMPHLASGGFWNAALYRWAMYGLGLLVSGWIVEKVMLLALFIALPTLAYRFLLPGTSRSTRLWIALFYTLNPFVYTRFLAGQWTILFAYSFLPLVWFYAKKLSTGERRAGIGLGLSLVLVFAFSLHLGVMALLVALCSCLSSLSKPTRTFWKNSGYSLLAFLVGTAYWTIPALLRRGGSIISVFDDRHLIAFRTASHPVLGVVGNVLALGGFWGEREAWAQQFIWPLQAHPILCGVAGLILGLLILWGIITMFRVRATRRQGMVFLGLGLLAFIFSCGVGDSPFFGINKWLFDHVGFWSGFRDSQKWSAVLVLVYAYFGGQGIESIRSVLHKRIVSGLAVLATLVFTFPMLFGFWGQLKPVWYPDSWNQANEILKQDPTCTAVFLPWHGYFRLNFNHRLLAASPARDFFACQIIQSREVELGDVGNQGLIDPAYDAIEGLVTGKDQLSPEAANELLRSRGVRYVIFVQDIQDVDPWKYAFLQSLGWEKMGFEGLTLYRAPG